MSKRYAGRSGEEGVPYRIVIRGELGEPLVGALEGMTVEVAGGDGLVAVHDADADWGVGDGHAERERALRCGRGQRTARRGRGREGGRTSS